MFAMGRKKEIRGWNQKIRKNVARRKEQAWKIGKTRDFLLEIQRMA